MAIVVAEALTYDAAQEAARDGIVFDIRTLIAMPWCRG